MVIGQVLVRSLRKKTFKPSNGYEERRAALLAGKGISHELAERFAAQHFLIPVQIFYIEELLASQLVVLGQITPRCINKKITPQEVSILQPKLTRGFEIINSLNLFKKVTLKKGQPVQDVIVIHGYAPEELRDILQLGLGYFQ